jgi:hypothetical protein
MSLGMDHEKTSVMGYKTLFEGSGIHHSDTRLQVTHDPYIKGLFMLVFDLTPDRAASEGHYSNPENGLIRIELPEPITCLLYLEFDNSIRVICSETSHQTTDGHGSDNVRSKQDFSLLSTV